MIPYDQLPTLNAILNSTCAVFLILGFLMIQTGRARGHRILMLSAFLVSIAFLASYIVYHLHTGTVHFRGTGTLRIVYFSILISHTILAALVPILAIVTMSLSIRGRIQRHMRFARWTLPIWLYVSVTGVVLYFMLYQW
jgi:uncharacterized membrane protein YozB (DUF420 family)